MKQVAAKLLADHSKNEAQLKALAKQLNVTLTPARVAILRRPIAPPCHRSYRASPEHVRSGFRAA